MKLKDKKKKNGEYAEYKKIIKIVDEPIKKPFFLIKPNFKKNWREPTDFGKNFLKNPLS